MEEFNYYKEFISKKYNYVLKPTAFINYSEMISNKFLLENEDILKKINLYQQILELKNFLEELVYILNMILLSTEFTPSPSFYLQENKKDNYIETNMIDYEIHASFHGGKKFAHLCIGKSPLFYLKQREMKEKFNDKQILQKITWNEPEILELKTYNESFLCHINYSSDKISFIKHILNKEKNEYEYFSLFSYNCEQMFNIKTYAIFSDKKVDGEKLKGFFIFKIDRDYYEINIKNKHDVLILRIKFFIDRVEIINCINKEKLIKSYHDFINN